jgi:hypothetical protein
MSGGMKIDNHSFWGGSPAKNSVFPDGPHKCKDESSAEGSGHIAYYEDTTEAIKKVQMDSNKKVKSYPMKTSHFH